MAILILGGLFETAALKELSLSMMLAETARSRALLLMAVMAFCFAAGAAAQDASADPVSESDQLLGVSKQPAPAQVAPGVAIVDMVALMLFHPRMQNYNFDTGTFERPFPANTTPEGRSRIVLERLQQREGRFRQNQARLEELGRQRYEVSQQIGRLQSELNRNVYDAKNQAGKIDVGAAIARLEQEFWKSRQALDAQYQKLNNEMLRLQDEADQRSFVSGKEREATIAAIETDVMEAIAALSKARGSGTVLNSAFISPDAPPQDRREAATSQIPLNQFDNPYATFWTAPQTKGVAPDEARGELASNLKRWVAYRSKLLTTVLARPINRLVLMGGRDLTLEALAYILRKHRVPEDRARLLLQTLQTMQRKG